MKNNLNRSLTELDNKLIPNKSEVTNVIKKHNFLLTKKLCDFTNEDLRFMIGQKSGLRCLVPIALSTLRENLFAEGDFYEGDILYKVLRIDKEFWEKNQVVAKELFDIVNGCIDFENFVTDEIKENLLVAADSFIHFILENYAKTD